MGIWTLVRNATGLDLGAGPVPARPNPAPPQPSNASQTPAQQGLQSLKAGQYPVPAGAPSGGYFTTNTGPDGKVTITGYAYQTEQGGRLVTVPYSQGQAEQARSSYNQSVGEHSSFLNQASAVAKSPNTVSGMSTPSGYVAETRNAADEARASQQSADVRAAAQAAAANPNLISGMSTPSGFEARIAQGSEVLARGAQTGDQRLSSFLASAEKRLEDIPFIGQSIAGERFLRENAPQGAMGLERVATDVLVTGYSLTFGLPAFAGRTLVQVAAGGQRLVMAPSEFVKETSQGGRFISEETSRQFRYDPAGTVGSAVVVAAGFLVAPRVISAEASVLGKAGGAVFERLPSSFRKSFELPERPAVGLSVEGRPSGVEVNRASVYELEAVTLKQRILTGAERTGGALQERSSVTFFLKEVSSAERRAYLAEGSAKSGTGALSLEGVGTERTAGYFQSPIGQRFMQASVERGGARLTVDPYANFDTAASALPLKFGPRMARYAELRAGVGEGRLGSLLFQRETFGKFPFRVSRYSPEVTAKLPSFGGSGGARMLGGQSYVASAEFLSVPRTLRSFSRQFDAFGEFRAGAYRSFTLRPGEAYTSRGNLQLPGSFVSGRASGVLLDKAGVLSLQKGKVPGGRPPVIGEGFDKPGAFKLEVQRTGFAYRRLGRQLPFSEEKVSAGSGLVSKQLQGGNVRSSGATLEVLTGEGVAQYMRRGVKARVREGEQSEYAQASLKPQVRESVARSSERVVQRSRIAPVSSMLSRVSVLSNTSQQVRSVLRSSAQEQGLMSRSRLIEAPSLAKLTASSEIPGVATVEGQVSQQVTPVEMKGGDNPGPIEPIPSSWRLRLPAPVLRGGGGSVSSPERGFGGGLGLASQIRVRPGKIRVESDLASIIVSEALYGKATTGRSRKRTAEFGLTGSLAFPTEELRRGKR